MRLKNQVPATAAADDATHTRHRWNATDLSLIAVFAAMVAALAILPAIPAGPLGVPVTLQTLAVMVTGIVLGPARGGAAVALYVLVGLAGLPIFSGFTGGVGVLAGPSAGYLIAFPLAAVVAGFLARLVLTRVRRFRYAALFGACMVSSLLVIHPLGIAGLMINGKLDFVTAVLADAIYLPGDVLKNLVAAAIGLSVHRAFPRLIGGRQRPAAPAPASTR
ncbi:biotin transporter BioY [Arthrobacter sp. CAN_A1]|uniref:biotin transporter BioY n=1 Tax=Arthrobacter sp. CAN_A1 TaxID=2787717 RepID=UPI0018CB93D8